MPDAAHRVALSTAAVRPRTHKRQLPPACFPFQETSTMRKIAVCICALVFSGAGVRTSHPVLADKPSWAGEGKKHEKKPKNQKAHRDREGDLNRDRDRQQA